jgi:hypothetical protein
MVMLTYLIRTLSSRPSAASSLIAISGCFLTEPGKRHLAQAETGEVFVGRNRGRSRPAVENRQFAEHRAGGKGHQPDVAVVVQEMDAGASTGDEIERRAGITVPKDDMSGRPGHRLQPAAQPFDLIGFELAQQRQPIERQFQRRPGCGLPHQAILGEKLIDPKLSYGP